MHDNELDRAEGEGYAFPETGDDVEILSFLVRYALLAPSSHNTQPWRFRLADGAALLLADRRRRLPVADPHDRELTISCGAALYYLQVAARYYGYTGEVELLPDPAQPDLLARLRLGVPRPPSEEDQRLFHALPRRRTRRGGFSSRAIAPSLLKQLQTAAAEEGASLIAVERLARERVAELVAEGDRRQGRSRRFRKELAAWVHSDGNARPDGIPCETFGFEGMLSYFGPLLLAHVNWGGVQAKRDQQAALDAPFLGLLSTPADDPADWLACGQALARLLLLACDSGVYAGYLNQPIQVPELRAQLQEALGAGHPQLLLRLGHGEEPPATPRRPLQDVLTD